MLRIANTPDEAYEICTKHAPACTGNIGTSSGSISGGSSSYSYSYSSSETSHSGGNQGITNKHYIISVPKIMFFFL